MFQLREKRDLNVILNRKNNGIANEIKVFKKFLDVCVPDPLKLNLNLEKIVFALVFFFQEEGGGGCKGKVYPDFLTFFHVTAIVSNFSCAWMI